MSEQPDQPPSNSEHQKIVEQQQLTIAQQTAREVEAEPTVGLPELKVGGEINGEVPHPLEINDEHISNGSPIAQKLEPEAAQDQPSSEREKVEGQSESQAHSSCKQERQGIVYAQVLDSTELQSSEAELHVAQMHLVPAVQSSSPQSPAKSDKEESAHNKSPLQVTSEPVMNVQQVKLHLIQPTSPIKAEQHPSPTTKLVFVKNNMPEKPKNTGYFQSRVLSIGKKQDDPFSVANLLKQQQPNVMNIELLLGEQVMINEDASLLTDKIKTDGKIVFTNYQLSFVSRDLKRINIPLGYIGKLERTVETRPVVYSTIDVTMKMGTTLKFKFTSAKEISINIFKVMGKFIYCEVGEVFAFSHWKAKKYTKITTDPRELAVMNGWDSYNWLKQYKRMGVSFDQGSPFRAVNNVDGKVCLSYPQHFLIPAKVSDEVMRKSMKNRSRDRLPALSYAMHITKQNKYVCLWRSSQMKFNVNLTRNLADEEYVKSLGNLTNSKSPKQKDIVIFELKQRSNTVTMIVVNSNRACSFPVENYKNAEVAVLEYESLQSLRQSYNKVIAASTLSDSSKWMVLVEQSRWYEYVAALLKDSAIIAEYLQHNENVLVQCSEGTDRTPQICSLAQIILDPYYRTFDGFAVLVEKEWMDFGHPFGLRMGVRKDKQNDERAPVFLQFLDCVSQLIRQYPLSFEFTCKYLAKIAFEAYSNRYGNFLCSSYKEQLENKIFQETLSIWGQLQQEHNELYSNPYFVLPQESDMFELRRPNYSPKGCAFFWQHFLKLTSEFKDDYRRSDLAQQNQDYPDLLHKQLRTEMEGLKKTLQLEQLEIARLRAQLQQLSDDN